MASHARTVQGGERVVTVTFYSSSIDELEISYRTGRLLKSQGIETIRDLLHHIDSELLCIPGFGQKTLREVRRALASEGIVLAGRGYSDLLLKQLSRAPGG